MNNVTRLFYVCLLLFPFIGIAQIQLEIKPIYNGIPLSLNTVHDSLTIETLKFYLSHFELNNDGKNVWQEENSFHLIDAENPTSLIFILPVKPDLNYNQLSFSLGVDSLTHASGAMGGDLDPTKGMYWSWKSGYINFKLEGKSPKVTNRQHDFNLHLGGYAGIFNCLQTVTLPIDLRKNQTIYFDVSNFLEKINLAENHSIMSPGLMAVNASKIAASQFKIDESK